MISKSVNLHRPFSANATEDENKLQREGGYGHIDAVKYNLLKGSQSNPFLDLLPVKQYFLTSVFARWLLISKVTLH